MSSGLKLVSILEQDAGTEKAGQPIMSTVAHSRDHMWSVGRTRGLYQKHELRATEEDSPCMPFVDRLWYLLAVKCSLTNANACCSISSTCVLSNPSKCS